MTMQWHSIHTHLLNGVVTMSRSLWSLNAANTLVIHISNQLTFQLGNLQDQNQWCTIDTDFNVFSIPNQLSWIIVFIIIGSYWMRSQLIVVWPWGTSNPCNIFELLVLIRLKLKYVAKWFISPTVLLLVSQYSRMTALNSPTICSTFSCFPYSS
jgi:hypothetical protein